MMEKNYYEGYVDTTMMPPGGHVPRHKPSWRTSPGCPVSWSGTCSFFPPHIMPWHIENTRFCRYRVTRVPVRWDLSPKQTIAAPPRWLNRLLVCRDNKGSGGRREQRRSQLRNRLYSALWKVYFHCAVYHLTLFLLQLTLTGNWWIY